MGRWEFSAALTDVSLRGMLNGNKSRDKEDGKQCRCHYITKEQLIICHKLLIKTGDRSINKNSKLFEVQNMSPLGIIWHRAVAYSTAC